MGDFPIFGHIYRGRVVVAKTSNDRPIKLESSWFSVKVILVMRLIAIGLLFRKIANNITINYIRLGLRS